MGSEGRRFLLEERCLCNGDFEERAGTGDVSTVNDTFFVEEPDVSGGSGIVSRLEERGGVG